MMKLAIMQPYLFPYIGYWQLMNAVDKFVLLDDVNFINRGWINRNRILVNGAPQLFTIPLVDSSQNKLIKDIDVVTDHKWIEKLLKTIQFSYKKAPYFKTVYPLIENILMFEEHNISSYICHSFVQLNKYIGIKTIIEPTSSIYNNGHFKAEDKILDICLQENAQTYFNPIGGTELYEKALFAKQNIELSFLKTHNLSYSQYRNEFVPWLSIIDVLMFNSSEEINCMLNKYELI